jgi:phosphoglycolate phosphatase-like HAD superfamily hydrolase
MKERSLIVLDLDGPLLEGRYRHHACYASIMRELGHEPIPLAAYWALKRGRTSRAAILATSGAAGCYEEFLRLWLERIEAPECLALDRLQPGVRSILETWKAAGRVLVLVTARRDAHALDAQLDRLELRRLFERVLAVPFAEDGSAKAAAFRTACGGRVGEIQAWVGDTEADVLAARALGVPSVALGCGIREEAYLKSLHPDHYYEDLGAMDREFWKAGDSVGERKGTHER